MAKPAAAKVAPAAKKPARAARTSLTPSERQFVAEYLIDLNGTQAYLRSHPKAKLASARVQASRLLTKPNIIQGIAEAKDARSEKTGITAERALKEAWAIVTADARELVEYHITCCRHCHGLDFGFQRTQSEYERDLKEFEEGDQADEWDSKGGVGFDPNRDPNPACPECFGKGRGVTHINDTRKLSKDAAVLYAGIKQTKEGIEVKMHSKMDALEKVFKHLGLYEKDNAQTQPLVRVVMVPAKDPS